MIGLRRTLAWIKMLLVRKHRTTFLAIWAASSLMMLSWLSEETGRAFTPPPPPDQDLHHFRMHRDLQHYLDNIEVLVEPSSVCVEDPPLVIMVTSTPSHVEHRNAIRETWGKHYPTYFVIGVSKHTADEDMIQNYIEAKLHSDMIIYDLLEHYQNMTLKSALMLDWMATRCRRADAMFKTDDDVVVNPWAMEKVLRDHPDAPLIGYMKNDTVLHRDEYTKWYIPRWLLPQDRVPFYLSGTGYLIKGEYIAQILQQAKKVPMINLEDIYITYLVSKNSLNLDLVHDYRLSPYKPWIYSDCAYWSLASLHSFKLDEIGPTWRIIEGVANRTDGACSFYKKHFESEWFLY